MLGTCFRCSTLYGVVPRYPQKYSGLHELRSQFQTLSSLTRDTKPIVVFIEPRGVPLVITVKHRRNHRTTLSLDHPLAINYFGIIQLWHAYPDTMGQHFELICKFGLGKVPTGQNVGGKSSFQVRSAVRLVHYYQLGFYYSLGRESDRVTKLANGNFSTSSPAISQSSA